MRNWYLRCLEIGISVNSSWIRFLIAEPFVKVSPLAGAGSCNGGSELMLLDWKDCQEAEANFDFDF
jgi:hypothetical protein